MLRAFASFLRRVCFSRRTLKIACFLLLAAGAMIFIADRTMVKASQQLTWSDVDAVPARNVGLLLGAKPGNNYFTRRVNSAAALYHAGKVKWLLVSGDNGSKNYDEASGMQQALIAKGVPTKAIFCDYAGFSTLDSVVRANKVFGENHITIISQEFHNQRAIWLAKQYNIDAIGFNAPDLEKGRGKLVRLREKLARVSAVIDAKILHRQPKYLGPSVMIGPFSEHGCPAKE
ncbi:vancomycin high temperature exclusion protein [Escherichia albertii]|uniref:SanA/YdcF family protein n=1 Tax=Escherichia albertii TaxID=208962 RepID=UPI00195B535D|nr:vancomycin high temperature exclusion protein [Escherichia albertii]EFO0996468.1 vancomycin high temperature exclusion protein [Escherichia albertii]ELY3286175.1 vancomycin high temperature exclusion protein [Escherichia albertii]MCU7308658.1 vancomycin high temperature exclusion protein [Escherichia albertii]MCZ8673343.1 vancomycin high temperature exclusion protein [Escherichia albertii]MCZ8809810.1 vancomycin high temperature exclusion protein [Escherichia albertii]